MVGYIRRSVLHDVPYCIRRLDKCARELAENAKYILFLYESRFLAMLSSKGIK